MKKPLRLVSLLAFLFLALPAPAQETAAPTATPTASVSPEGSPATSASPAKKKRKQSPLSQLPPEVRAQLKTYLPMASGFLGGALIGVLLLILGLQRRQLWAGVGALALSIILGGLLTATASFIAAIALWFYLRRQEHPFAHVARHPSPWIVFAGMVGVMLCYFAAQITVSTIGIVSISLENPGIKQGQLMEALLGSDRVLLSYFNAIAFCILLLIVICRPQSTASWRDRFGFHRPPIKSALFWMLGGAIAIVAANLTTELISDQKTSDALAAMTGAGASFAIVVLVFCIAGPLFEELVFRGYAFSGWIDKIGPAWTILATSLAFAVCHLQYGPVGMAVVFVLGLIFGVLRLKTGSLYPCIVLHLATNLSAFLLSR